MCKSGELFVGYEEEKEIKKREYDTAISIWRGIRHSYGNNRVSIVPNQEFRKMNFHLDIKINIFKQQWIELDNDFSF